MFKNRNTGTGNGMRGTRGMGGECYIPENIAQHSGECSQTFRGMFSNILGNVPKHSVEFRQTFQGMSSNIKGNVPKNSEEYRKTFRGMSQNIRGMSPNIPGNILQTLFML